MHLKSVHSRPSSISPIGSYWNMQKGNIKSFMWEHLDRAKVRFYIPFSLLSADVLPGYQFEVILLYMTSVLTGININNEKNIGYVMATVCYDNRNHWNCHMSYKSSAQSPCHRHRPQCRASWRKGMEADGSLLDNTSRETPKLWREFVLP